MAKFVTIAGHLIDATEVSAVSPVHTPYTADYQGYATIRVAFTIMLKGGGEIVISFPVDGNPHLSSYSYAARCRVIKQVGRDVIAKVTTFRDKLLKAMLPVKTKKRA